MLRGEPDDGHLLGLHARVAVFGQQEDYGLFRCSVLGLYNTVLIYKLELLEIEFLNEKDFFLLCPYFTT